MINFLPLIMNALQQNKADKETADTNAARAYMGQAPVERDRSNMLQGVIGPGGGAEAEAEDGMPKPGKTDIDLGSAKYNDMTPENKAGPPGMQQLGKGTGSYLDDTFGTKADDKELLY